MWDIRIKCKKANLKFLKCEVYETKSRTKNDIVLGCSNNCIGWI